MGKYRKDKITLGNVLKVVEALLTLADEEISIPGDKLKATFKLEWVKEDELQVSGKVEEKRRNKIQTSEKGITKDDLWTLTEWIGKTLEISPSLDGTKKDSPEKKKQAVQDVLDCLTDLKLLEDKRPHGKNDKSGYWKFHLKLKHQTKRKENLKLIQEKWKDEIGQVPDWKLETPTKKPIDWREICQRNLAQQKELTTNPFTNAYGIAPKLDKVYVPLAIVERKPPKPKSENQPEEQEQETLIFITKNRFFEEVLRQGKSEISQGRKIAIIGEPGSGKTTRLQKIADWILEKDLGLPIWVSLADLSQATVYQYLEETWLKQTGENLTIDALKQEKKRIWLLLDGVDEMTSKIESRHVSALLGGWLQDARVVMTCRVNVWEADKNAFSGFDVFKNLEFSREQVNQYIGNWFQEIGDAATGESLEKELAKSENLAFNRLIQNPLRLWMLCQIWQTGGGLPDTQAELYRQFVDWVYRWKADEEILNQRSEIDQALAQLALAAMKQKDEVSRFQLSESWIVKVLESRKIFKALEKLGWLNRIERLPEAIYVFYHATFQEYFAALAVDDWDDFLPRNHVNFPVPGKEYSENLSFPRRRESTIPERKPQYRIFQPQWKQVILFWLGRRDVADEKKEAFIEKLVKFDDGCGEWNFKKADRGFYEYRAYFLAAAGINEFKTCSRCDTIVKQIVQWGFGYYHQEKQQWRTFLKPIKFGAREILPQTDRKRTIQELCQILEHPQWDEDTRWQAADCLGKIDPGNQTAIAALGKVLETTKDEDTRWQAADCLGKIDPGNQTAIAALVKVIETTKNEYTRYQAAKSLGEIGQGNETAIAALVKVIETTKNEYTRYQAAKSLGEIGQGNETAIAALVRILETTDNEDTRWQAAYCLGEIGQGNETALAALVKVIATTDNENTRWQAAYCLGEIAQSNETAIAALVRILETTDNENTLCQVAKSLGKIAQGNETAISALVRILETTDNENTRCQVAESLESLGKIAQGNETAIAALVKVLATTDNENTRCQAAQSLAEIDPGNETAIAALVKVLATTDNENIRCQAAKSLAEIDPGNKTAIAALVKVIETTKNEYTRWWAAYSLGKIDPGNETAIAALVKVIATTDIEYIRRQAAFRLGEIGQGNETAIAALLKVLATTDNENARRQAAKSLGEIAQGNETAIAGLVKVIATTDNEVTRWQAADSLEEIITTDENRKYVVTALQPYLTDETYQNNFSLWINCYKMLWKIAQDLPYPDFYNAWHGLNETSTLVQNLELAQLPKNLQTQLTETNLNQTIQVFYIDGSKFIGDNPAKAIYRQMTQQGGRKIEDKPGNMADLQDYWADLIDENDQPPVLIFYQDPNNGIPQGFSETFLDLLTRFDGIICLITDQTHPPLQTFSPQYPQLIHNIVAWLQRRILEM